MYWLWSSLSSKVCLCIIETLLRVDLEIIEWLPWPWLAATGNKCIAKDGILSIAFVYSFICEDKKLKILLKKVGSKLQLISNHTNELVGCGDSKRTVEMWLTDLMACSVFSPPLHGLLLNCCRRVREMEEQIHILTNNLRSLELCEEKVSSPWTEPNKYLCLNSCLLVLFIVINVTCWPAEQAVDWTVVLSGGRGKSLAG